VIATCGGLPGDWDRGAYQPIRASVLHIASREDEYYPLDKTESHPEVLRRHAAHVEFQLIDGTIACPEMRVVL
jgi:hypothetical protein